MFPTDPAREFLRHTLAATAYRAGKALRGAPASFANYGAESSPQTPARILAHMGDLMDWGLSMSQGHKGFHESTPLEWDQEVARFFQAVTAWDGFLASDAPVQAPLDRLFQGPVADAINHVGQIAMLRRMAGCKIGGENYYVADIVRGRVGQEQSPPKKEF